jgi:uncharacterized protein
MLLDTSGLLCFHDSSEPRHTEAVALFTTALQRLTHNYVLAEFVPLAERRRLPRKPVLDFLSNVQRDPAVQVVYVDEPLHDEAMNLLERRLDKTWSLCDAVSFVLMQSRGIFEALTTDHHFEQAGFVRLLTP